VIAAANACIVETYRPGVMDRLVLGFDAVYRVNPRIIYLSDFRLRRHRPLP